MPKYRDLDCALQPTTVIKYTQKTNGYMFNQQRKYGWQKKRISKKRYGMKGLNLMFVMTGEGKTIHSLKQCKQNFIDGIPETWLIYGSHHKYLPVQYYMDLNKLSKDGFLEIVKCDETKGLIIVKFNGYDKEYTIRAKQLPHNNDDIFEFFRGNDGVAFHIDEFHAVASQFGLSHSHNRYCHGECSFETKIFNSLKNKPNLHRTLSHICKNSRVIAYSGTMDDLMCEKLLPYMNDDIEINSFVFRPSRLSMRDIKCLSLSFETMFKEMVKSYKNDCISIAWVANEKMLNAITDKLKEAGINDYYTCYGDEQLDHFKAGLSKLRIFINKGTTGYHADDINRAFVFRQMNDTQSNSTSKKLKSNDCVNDTNFSNILHQMVGRIRNDGKCIIQSKDGKDNFQEEDYYDIVIKIFDYPFNENVIRKIKIYNQLQKVKPLNDSTINRNIIDYLPYWYIRPFIFGLITNIDHGLKKNKKNKNTGNGILNDILDKYEEILSRLRTLFSQDNRDNFINLYKEYEDDIIQRYIDKIKTYKCFEKLKLKEITSDTQPEHHREGLLGIRGRKRNGGGTNRHNIGIKETRIMMSMMDHSIFTIHQQRGITSKSVDLFFRHPTDKRLAIFINNNSDNPYIMHSKEHCLLTKEEQKMGRFAIPLSKCPIGRGLNALEEEDGLKVLPWVDGKITCDYEVLKHFVGESFWEFLRPKDEIDAILVEYNIRMGNC